ncbi:MAG: nitrilase-related carbon-nitrogen hydrolase [Candidatus Zixiibacteriota bacterium]
MKIRLIQKDIGNPDYRRFLDEAVGSHADIVCFPELTTSGCLYDGGQGVDFEELARVLREYPFAVFIGFPRSHEGRLYNSYMYFHGGEYQIYDKINLFEPMNEASVYTPGSAPGLIQSVFGVLGVATCYDLRFPELFNRLAIRGAKMIFVPSAFPRVRVGDFKELIVQRAIENSIWVVGINAVGDDGVNEFGGSSMVADPDGQVLAQADETSETVLDVTI